jgi:hypothetical protein
MIRRDPLVKKTNFNLIKRQESLSVRYIRSIQTVKSNRKIPKAFEIFTNTNR